MTSAIAPSGCTTISGAYESAASWQTIASPSMTVPTTHDGRVEQTPQLCSGEAARARRAAQLLDLGHAAVLILRAERHEHGTEQGERDADQQVGVLEYADERVAHILRARPPSTPRVDTSRRCRSVGSRRGRSADSHHGRSRPACPRVARRRDHGRDPHAGRRHVRDDGCRTRRGPRGTPGRRAAAHLHVPLRRRRRRALARA